LNVNQDYNTALVNFQKVLEVDKANIEANKRIKECKDAIDAENKKIIEQITALLDKADNLAKSTDAIELKAPETLETNLKQLNEAEEDVNRAIALCEEIKNSIDDSTRLKADGGKSSFTLPASK